MSPFVQYFPMNSQRIHYNLIIRIKLHKIHATKCRSVLILFSSSHLQLLTFYIISILSYVIFTQRKFQPFFKSTNYRNSHCRRSSQTRTGRNIHISRQFKRERYIPIKAPHNRIINTTLKQQLPL